MPADTTPLPLITVIVPCRNEERYIGACLDSIAASDYPPDRLEVLVVDGASTDDTRAIVSDRAARHPFIRVIHNEKRITPVALNLGITAARGEFIVWMSSHNVYEPTYIRESVEWALRTQADNVGGVIVTRGRSSGLWATAVVTALTHPFGVGASHFRVHRDSPSWVDTVFGGCYRRDVFARIGLFNERLVRGQDMEFNLRLRRAGGRILLVPTIRSEYYARTEPLEFARHTWSNGEWAILPFLYSEGMPVGFRHLVPLLFALAISATVLAGILGKGWWMLGVLAGAYASANLVASVTASVNRRKPALVLTLPLAFGLLHLCYGYGSVSGGLRLLTRRARRAPR